MKNALIVTLVCFVAAAAANFQYLFRSNDKLNEEWLHSVTPTQVRDFRLAPKTFDATISYEMGPDTYDTLKPIGISCQILTDTVGRKMDVVVIAGDTMDAFHDQQICFSAQDWEIRNITQVKLNIPGFKEVTANHMRISQKGQSPIDALYLVQTPTGFYGYERARWEYFFNYLRKGKAEVGYSYRFIGLTPDVQLDELKGLAEEYIADFHQNIEAKPLP